MMLISLGIVMNKCTCWKYLTCGVFTDTVIRSTHTDVDTKYEHGLRLNEQMCCRQHLNRLFVWWK